MYLVQPPSEEPESDSVVPLAEKLLFTEQTEKPTKK